MDKFYKGGFIVFYNWLLLVRLIIPKNLFAVGHAAETTAQSAVRDDMIMEILTY